MSRLRRRLLHVVPRLRASPQDVRKVIVRGVIGLRVNPFGALCILSREALTAAVASKRKMIR